MFTNSFHRINAVRAEIVKYSQAENLKNFYTHHPECGLLPEDVFTRNRSLPFSNLLHFLLYPRAKSTAIELLEYSHLISKPNVNKSDFSRRRKLIPADYLKSMHRDIVSAIYSEGPVVKWHGHLLLAGDGTTYSIPDTPGLRERYLQGRKTGNSQQPLARGVVIKDVFNDLIVASNMVCYGRDEITLLLEELDKVLDMVDSMQPVVVLDRKFCAYTLLAPLVRKGWGFIIRVKERFNAQVDEFMASGMAECDITLRPALATLKKLRRLYGRNQEYEFPVRLVRLSENVVVMTSVKDISLRDSQTNPYHLRWDDETTIGFLKNNLQIEIFSSSVDNSIRQDFHAKTIVYNLLSLLCHQAAELRHDDGKRKINRNVALGILKLEFGIFIQKDKCSFNNRLQRMLNELIRFTIPVIDHRHNPRVFRKMKTNGKYITLHNYREAI